ncbi:MAG: DUF2905 domain-containing protein [Verrucomicrobiales bacterium]|nr:DUF2905 domain-containing protein [Verrucomicrobiales bacterium]
MQELGKMLVWIGLVILGTGVVLWSGFGRDWLGKLPGDLRIERGEFSFHFPIVTCLVISLVLTLLAWMLRR